MMSEDSSVWAEANTCVDEWQALLPPNVLEQVEPFVQIIQGRLTWFVIRPKLKTDVRAEGALPESSL